MPLQSMLLTFQDGLNNGTHPADLLQQLLTMQPQPFAHHAGARCVNLHSTALSPRGDGSEAFALVTPVATASPASAWQAQDAFGGAVALAIGATLTRHMASVPWLLPEPVHPI